MSADGGDATTEETAENNASTQPEQQAEEEKATGAGGDNIELVALGSHSEDEEKKEEEEEEPDDDENAEAVQRAKQTIHEDSEDSKQFYKLDDFELEYNVKNLKDRFEKLVNDYSAFDEDIYTVPEKELMDVLGNLAIDSYGILLWILCMDQLETERKKIIWDILIFLAMRMPTEVAMGLLQHYSSNMARYSPTDVSELSKALVHGSEFALATCLVLSAFFVEAAKQDLTRDKQLRELSQEYAIRATRILEEIENDYLAVIMLETPSFHDGKSPLEIALENNIIDFLACNKVSRISNAMWTLQNVMQVDGDTTAAFALSDFSASDIHAALLEDSRAFYFSSMGYWTVEVITYLLYLGVFTYLTHLRQDIDTPPTWLDYTFWCANIGFVLGELIELGYDGWTEYFSKWQNWLDTIISINFILIIVVRSTFTVLKGFGALPKDLEGDETDNVLVQGIVILYKCIWALNIVILWVRLLHFMMLSRAFGPLITNIKNMIKDIASFGKMYILILLGFVFGLYFLIGGKNGNVLFRRVDTAVITLMKTTLGQLEWECVRDIELENTVASYTANGTLLTSAVIESCDCDYDGGCEYLSKTNATRGDFATLLLIVFSLVTLIVLFNLLTAMMATTYRLITERSDKEVLSRKVALGVEYDRNSQVMPPPLNILVVALFVLYSIIDALLLLFTQKFISESYGGRQWKCAHCNCLNDYEDDDEFDPDDVSMSDMDLGPLPDDSAASLSAKTATFVCVLCGEPQSNVKVKRRVWRNPRQYSEGDGRWKTFVMGLKELLDIESNDDNGANKRSSNVSMMDHHKDALSSKQDDDILDDRMQMEQRIKRKDWICGYCRNRIPAGQLGHVEIFKNRLAVQDIRVDEDDVEEIQQINPLLCPICYRVVSVRSRIIFVMEMISYYVFLFILYPVIRICLMPIYFFQTISAWTGQENDDDDDPGNKNQLDFLSGNDSQQARTLKEIEELLPSDLHTRTLLNPSHKIWKVLKQFQKKQGKINMDEKAKAAHDDAAQSKREKQASDEALQLQRQDVADQLESLIEQYWNTRLDASERAKEHAKRKQSQLLEIDALMDEIAEIENS